MQGISRVNNINNKQITKRINDNLIHSRWGNMKKSKISLALLAAIAVQIPSYAFAAEAEETAETAVEVLTAKERAAELKNSEIEVITVGGMRSSEVAAINMKKFSDTISDNLSAEEVGALPDQSIAESLERLAGVSGNQSEGRSNTISVRGMGGAYTLTTLNNREIVSSFGSRSINLSLFPSSSIRRAQVYKTARADSLEGGISGQVNMETFKPLEVDRDIRMISATINGTSMYDDLNDSDPFGTSIDGMFSQHFGDDFAISVGASVRDDMRYLEGISMGGKVLGTHSWLPDRNGDGIGDYAASAAVLNSKLQTTQQNSIFVAAQWQLNDDLLISADFLTSSYNYQQKVVTLSNGVFWGIDWLVPEEQSDVDPETGFLMSGLVRKVPQMGNNGYDGGGFAKWDASVLNEDKTEVMGINFEYFLTDDLMAELDISHSSAERLYSWRSLGGRFGEDVDHYYRFSDREDSYTLEYLGADSGADYHGTGTAFDMDTYELDESKLTNTLGDASDFQFNSISNSIGITDSAVTAIKLDFTLDVDYGVVHTLKFGMRHSVNTKEHIADDLAYDRDDQEDGAWDAVFGHLDMVELSKTVSNDPFQVLDNITGFDNLFYMDAGDVIGSMPEFFNNREARDDVDKFASYELEEKTNAAYIQASFAGDWYDGIVGVRYYETKLEATSWQSNFAIQRSVNDDTGQPREPESYDIVILGDAGFVTSTNDYSDFLPTLNVNFRIIDDVVIRLGLGKAMIRPSLGEINNSLELNDPRSQSNAEAEGSGGRTLGTAGNPYLMPITSKQADLSFEWYPSESSDNFYAFATFYKDLDGIYEQGATYIPVDGSVDRAGNQLFMPVTSEVKEEGGNIKGWEVSFRQSFETLSDYLVGFALSANYMKMYHGATQDYNNRNPGDAPLYVPTEIYDAPHGWLDSTYNIALTYDHGRDFSARLNLNQQSQHNVRNGRDHKTQMPAKNLSLNLRYRVSKEVVLNAQAANLLNESTRSTFLSGDHVGFAGTDFTAQEQARGITYYAGIRVTF